MAGRAESGVVIASDTAESPIASATDRGISKETATIVVAAKIFLCFAALISRRDSSLPSLDLRDQRVQIGPGDESVHELIPDE